MYAPHSLITFLAISSSFIYHTKESTSEVPLQLFLELCSPLEKDEGGRGDGVGIGRGPRPIAGRVASYSQITGSASVVDDRVKIRPGWIHLYQAVIQAASHFSAAHKARTHPRNP